MDMQKLEGLIAAPFTAFDADGELNLSAVEKQLELLAANGIRGALVGGTTGECGSMTLEERMIIAERWCELAKPVENFSVVVHVGHSCLKDSQVLSRHAAQVGVSVRPLSHCYRQPGACSGLIIGYGSVDERAIEAGVRSLKRIITQYAG